MDIKESTALFTGANRGIGLQFVSELRRRGATKIYAAARRPETIDLPGVVPLQLDITDAESVAAAAAAATDVTLLINNAGISTFAKLVDGPLPDIRNEMDTNYFGTLRMVRAFAPTLAKNGGGAILNVLSVMAWMAFEHSNSYSASKAAAWSLTNGIRVELADQHTQVTGLAMASVDTDMMAGIAAEKTDPNLIARRALDASKPVLSRCSATSRPPRGRPASARTPPSSTRSSCVDMCLPAAPGPFFGAAEKQKRTQGSAHSRRRSPDKSTERRWLRLRLHVTLRHRHRIR